MALLSLLGLFPPSASSCFLLGQSFAESEQAPPPSREPPPAGLRIVVIDENKVAVRDAHVEIIRESGRYSCQTDFAGRCNLPKLPPGQYFVSVQAPGFYISSVNNVDPRVTPIVEMVLAHQQEFKETITVVASLPVIDPTQTASSETLDSKAIISIPYPTTRDIRAILPFIPGVVADRTGQVHVAGSAGYESYIVLDDFDVTDPVSGLLNLRVSADGVRKIEVQASRYSVQYGKGSGGLMRFQTGMGEDRFRYSVSNFLPSFEFKKGFNYDKWVPRASFSGPIVRGRSWFFAAPDAEIDSNIMKELPKGADRAPLFRTSNLLKAQINLSDADILTGSFLYNWLHQDYAGLSVLSRKSTTTTLDQSAYFSSLKEQHTFSRGTLVELGVGSLLVGGDEDPLGPQPLIIQPGGNSGNAFRTLHTDVRRLQGIANIYLSPWRAAGRHDVQMGLEFDAINYDQKAQRKPILVLRRDGTLSSQITLSGNGNFTQTNGESSGYIQDRWSWNDRLLFETGVRIDRDQIIDRIQFSPRFATAYSLTPDTKFSGGVGVYYDATNLEIVSRPLQGSRIANHYAGDGITFLGTDLVVFRSNPAALQAPRTLNLSFGVEHKFPNKIYLRSEYIRKRGEHGFVYANQTPQQNPGNTADFLLTSAKQDHYDALQTTVLHPFKNEYYLQASYTRSSARSNAVLDFSPEQVFDPLSAAQLNGPLSWDAPNRFVSYGWLPLVKSLDFSYTLEWRTGFPFSITSQQQRILGAPNSHRFPDYFDLGVYAEKRFPLMKLNWAIRGGFDNITDRHNPSIIDNDVQTPPFFRFRQFTHRTFVVRMRFLGKKQ